MENWPLDTLIASCDWILCGTSLSSELEWSAMGLARRAGKRAVAVLDHWVNYRLRFVRRNVWNFPDEVWVGDEVSARIASETLPEVASRLVPNAYFADVLEELASFSPQPRPAGAGVRILYTCSPLHEGAEIGALRYFLANVGHISDRIESVTLRPHPRERKGRYTWALDEFDLPLRIDADRPLVEQVAGSDIVAGCATMAMVVGLLAGRRVVSCIPPGDATPPLPHSEIERLQDLIDMRIRAEWPTGDPVQMRR
jgi:hypothetical protein